MKGLNYMGVLLKVYRGEISAVEDVVPQSSEYKKAIELLCKEREYLEKVLSEKDKKHLYDFNDLRVQTEGINCEEHFMYGFKLGMKMMMEILKKEK